MTGYTAPLSDIRHALRQSGRIADLAQLPAFAEVTPDLVDSILDEAAKIASGVLAPLNRAGDLDGARLQDGVVRTTPGWPQAWAALVEGGWNGVAAPTAHGGMGLPQVLNLAVQEMWHSANMAFALCPMLTLGAANAIETYGSEAQKARYLPRLISGEWTGTMNLTEPMAGSDLAAIATRAMPDGDAYLIRGQKIFITYGDHDMADNIVHLVLARLPDAPAGVRGISLFIVPKRLDDGTLNDLRCISLEHKLGIHGSPTAVLAFGEGQGARAELIGEPHRGLEYMFAMMNHARLNVGLQGLAIAERAYQQALAYARDRRQGQPMGAPPGAAIIEHPDVRRMLMSTKSRIQAMRGLLYDVAAAHDIAHAHPDAQTRAKAQQRVDLLTPVAKGWCTETGIDIASLAVQIHGGMGYIEETGVAQHWSDSRITTIYEGTTGIQANDLVGRKLIRDQGAAARAVLTEIAGECHALAAGPLAHEAAALAEAAAQAGRSIERMLASAEQDPRLPFAGAVAQLQLLGVVLGGRALLRDAAAAIGGDAPDQQVTAALGLARFYTAHSLPQVASLAVAATEGAGAVFALPDTAL